MADKNTGKGVSNIFGANHPVVHPMDVKAFSFLHRQGTNACSKKPCSHICVPMPDQKYTCLCPDGLKAFTENDKTVCKCPDGSDDHGDGTCPQNSGTCSPEQFTCQNQKCIPNGWMCNGNDDCGDGSDETDPKCHELQCGPNKWKCANGERCIPENWRCDYDEDCSDGSDEHCNSTTTCGPNEFQCKNGQCITNKWKCDLENDCMDGSDEDPDTCREAEHLSDDHTTCRPNEQRCTGSPQCLPSSWWCDGDFDCPNEEDEQNCKESTCHDWQFDCGEGHCIFATWRCDGDQDCHNGIDEQNCTATESPDTFALPRFPNATQCNEWTFKCNNGQCIPYWWKCDGSKDCSDESDELECHDDTTTSKTSTDHGHDPDYVPSCGADKFMCPVTYDCIWEAWLCDGENDCQGGEDEADEICANRPKCDRNMFRCEKSGQCVSYEQVCDQIVQCPDGSDEFGCDHEHDHDSHYDPICPENQFPCDAGICIPDEKMCDGINDCVDATGKTFFSSSVYFVIQSICK